MNESRYLAYRRVRDLLDSAEAEELGPAERELVRDLAEQMLLTRPGEAEQAEEVAHSATVALRTLSAQGTVARTTASDLWDDICAAGPDTLAAPTPVFPGPVSAALRSY